MAANSKNATRPQNVLAKENAINMRITSELLPRLPSFVAEYDQFLDTQNRSVKTREAYLKDITYFFEYMIGGTGLSEAASTRDITLEEISNLKGRDVNRYLNHIKRYEEGGKKIENGNDSRARKRSSIVGLLKYLYLYDLIEHDISGKILSISVKNEHTVVKALQENESAELMEVVETGFGLTPTQLKFWKHTRYRDRLIIALLSIAGLRVSELQQLNISSFNLKREEFIVYRKRGKASVLPLNKTLLTIFEEYMANDRKICADVASGHEDALFLCMKTEARDPDGNIIKLGRTRLSERQIRDIVHKYTAIVIGDKKGYSPHKLRATAATVAIQRGNDISRVASLLDHDSITTTKRYVKVTDEDKRKVLESMD